MEADRSIYVKRQKKLGSRSRKVKVKAAFRLSSQNKKNTTFQKTFSETLKGSLRRNDSKS